MGYLCEMRENIQKCNSTHPTDKNIPVVSPLSSDGAVTSSFRTESSFRKGNILVAVPASVTITGRPEISKFMMLDDRDIVQTIRLSVYLYFLNKSKGLVFDDI